MQNYHNILYDGVKHFPDFYGCLPILHFLYKHFIVFHTMLYRFLTTPSLQLPPPSSMFPAHHSTAPALQGCACSPALHSLNTHTHCTAAPLLFQRFFRSSKYSKFAILYTQKSRKVGNKKSTNPAEGQRANYSTPQAQKKSKFPYTKSCLCSPEVSKHSNKWLTPLPVFMLGNWCLGTSLENQPPSQAWAQQLTPQRELVFKCQLQNWLNVNTH